MPADTSVKYIHSGMTGAPTNNNALGCITAILDATLVNGFGSGNLDSLVVATNVATATRSAGHPFEVGTVVEIAGATPAGLNGQHRVLTATTTTYTFETSGISDQTATGTITHKVAPLGWEKQFSTTNKAAYRSTDLTSTRCVLWVDDNTNAQYAFVRGYKSMTDINTGVDMFPTITQEPATDYLYLRNIGSGNAEWIVIGTKKCFYFFIQHNRDQSLPSSMIHHFGDFISYRVGDPYACAIAAWPTSSHANTSEQNFNYGLGRMYQETWTYAPRNVTGVGSASLLKRSNNSPGLNSTNAFFSGSSGLVYPNTADNGIYLCEYFLQDTTPYNMRGKLPGVYGVQQNVISTLTHKSKTGGILGYPGRQFLSINTGTSVTMFDITGPWE